uniref:methyl-accepting chemotaxis protein n=2 Tax=Bacillus tuaregi TaxID=1816695 RepID=UPI0008F96EF4|nr:methyl-accepting chemotaxis protein [Bacillus tuaregi]
MKRLLRSFLHIRTKLIISFSLLLLIPTVTIGLLSYQTAEKAVVKEVTAGITENIELINTSIENTINPKLHDIETFSGIVAAPFYEEANTPELRKEFSRYIELHPEAELLYVGTTTGLFIQEPDTAMDADYDPRERDWYKAAMDRKGELVISEPYVSATTGQMVVTISQITQDHSGVVAVDINLNQLQQLMNQVNIGETGFASLLDGTRKYIAHPTIQGGSEGKESFLDTVFKQEKGQLDYILKDKESVLTFGTNPLTGWKIAISIEKDEVNEEASYILKNTLLIIGIAIMIGAIAVTFITKSIIRPLNELKEKTITISNGDLTERIHVRTNDEIGQVGQAFNDMQDKLKELMVNIANASEVLSYESEELTQSANEVQAGSAQVALIMQEIASGSEAQANTSSEMSSIVANFASKVQEANEQGEQIQESSHHVLKLTNEGSTLMDASTKQMTKIDQIVRESVQKVQELDQQSQQISQLVVVIKEVADQTNLLALNAAIEAARAGEHGKGFSVVAEEVRKLAEQTATSVTDITTIVQNIQNGFNGVTETLHDGYEEVEKGTAQIETTGETFTWISQSVTEMVNSINTISGNLSDISANSQEINGSIQEIAAAAEQSVAGIQETSASIQQTSSSMEDVARSSNDLSKLSEELNGLVKQFKI